MSSPPLAVFPENSVPNTSTVPPLATNMPPPSPDAWLCLISHEVIVMVEDWM
jgi:hypothetical protein